MLRTAVLLALVALFSVAALSCDESESITVENKTGRTVVVYEDGVPTEIIHPGITKEFTTGRFRGTLTYEIRYLCDEATCDQTVLASRTLTWEEMQNADGIAIVIQ